jgi:hypothetical protein
MSWSVTLYSAAESTGVGRIVFSDATPARGDFRCTASAEIDGETWSVSLVMIDVYQRDMLGYFEELAAGGWKGENRWSSEFAEMDLTTTLLDEELARVQVLMRWSGYEREGGGEIVVRRDEFPRVLCEMREFLRLDEGARFMRGTYERPRRS